MKAGERVYLKVSVNVLKEAEYVLIEIPVPAGCIIVNKSQGGHREYFKNKVVVFAEQLAKGRHTYEIELEPRYSGHYTLNPVRAELMYFPTFFGRNEMRRVQIR